MGAWTDDDDDWLEEGAGTPLPYQDQDVVAALAAEGPPEWLGTRWREIPAEQQWDAWNGLRRWVDWLVKEYRLTNSDVPVCWYRHSDITAELYAAMCMEYKVWEEQAPNLGPMMMWHPNLAQMIMRLKQMTKDAGCTQNGAHKEPVAYSERVGANEVDYDEDDWLTVASTIRTETTVERPQQGRSYVRASVIDPSTGQVLGVSTPAGLRARTIPGDVSVNLAYQSATPGVAGMVATVRGGPEGAEVAWEISEDGQTWTDLNANSEDTTKEES